MTSENNKNILQKPSEESTLQNIYNTKKALEKLSNHRIKTYQSFKTNNLNVDSNKNNQLCYKYINYQFDSNNNNNSNKNSHLIKLVALPVDPLSNLKYKHHKIPLSNTNEKNFVPVLHSAPAPLSLEEQKKWKIPPCVNMSNNPKGLVIPLDIRLANDGRNLREYKANKNFAKFADILAMTEKNVRKEIEERNKIAQSIQIAAAMKKEKELKEAAKQARMERKSYTNKNSTNNNSSMVYSLDTSDILNNKEEEGNYLLKNKRERSKDKEEKESKERTELREIRKKEIEYERRLELIKQYEKEGRDINDKILLGQNNMINNNNVIDSRLYELEGGIENPFDYNEDCQVYDKPLFNGKNKLSNIYKNFNSLGGENSKKLMGKILSQKGKLFNSDLEAINSRKEGPVQFEKANKE